MAVSFNVDFKNNLANLRYDDRRVVNSSVFTKVNFLAEQKSQDELKALSQNIDKLSKQNNIKTSQSSEFAQKIYFKDQISGQFMSLGMSDENINKLKTHFGYDDFYENKDGSLILTGNAEAYVGGWFADIAYKRGFLEADNNKDGYLDDNELDKTKSLYFDYGDYKFGKPRQVTDFISKGMVRYRELKYGDNRNERFAKHSIEEELDRTLQKDSNNDGLLSFSEAMNRQQRLAYLKESLSNKPDWGNFINGKSLKEETKKVEEATNAKVKAFASGFDKLSDGEKKLVLDVFPNILNEIKLAKEQVAQKEKIVALHMAQAMENAQDVLSTSAQQEVKTIDLKLAQELEKETKKPINEDFIKAVKSNIASNITLDIVA